MNTRESFRSRADVLAVIDAIQQGMAAELDFPAIVDVAGGHLRLGFHTRRQWLSGRDEAAGEVRYLYDYEHGRRMALPSCKEDLTRPLHHLLMKRQPVVMKDRAHGDALGLQTFAGTDQCRSAVFAPMFSADRLLGTICIENHEREDAFSDAEVRLIATVAASTGVALENARLFAETQRLLKETERRNAELAVINSIQQGLASNLALQGVIELVGDKLREVFATGDLMITWRDEA